MMILFHYHELALHLSSAGNSTFYFINVEDALKSEDHRKNLFLCLSTAVCGSFVLCTSGNIPLSLTLPTSMARGLTFTTVGLTALIVLVLVHPTCCAPTAMVNDYFCHLLVLGLFR